MDIAIEQSQDQQLADVHAALIQALLTVGYLPRMSELAVALTIEPQELSERLSRLAEAHGLVLHPHATEPWIVHPFSTSPTLHYVEGEHCSWWAPCIWCAFGIAQLVGGPVRIHTRLGAETEPRIIEVKDGVPASAENFLVHFSIPPRDAWNNVHHHCALVLPFHTQAEIVAWCERHGHSFGEAVSLEATARLARRWYGRYAQRSWRKWTVEQARQIFQHAGLTSPFWELPGKGTY